MVNRIHSYTAGLLRMNVFLLFLLIACPLSIGIYTQPPNTFSTFNRLLQFGGAIIWILWLFAIGNSAQQKLQKAGLVFPSAGAFNWAILVALFAYVQVIFVSHEVTKKVDGFSLHYYAPFYLLFLSIILSVVICSTTAKMLVSADLNKDARLNDFLSTAFLLAFVPIGIWYIQPRVKKLNNIISGDL